MSCLSQPAQADRELFAQVKAQAEKGDAESQLRLGSLYATGAGVAKDLSKAARWHRKAAEQGLARAQYRLGLDYASGSGLKPNSFEAVNWFRKAAEQGLPEAQYELGACSARGSGVGENYSEAARWFLKAAQQGYPPAQFQLAQCYFEGAGVVKDIEEAVKWTRLAADKGYAPAQNRLGACFEKGEGMAQDYLQAYKWFLLSAAQDDEMAPDIRVSIAKIETSMSPEQIAQAQRAARDFKPINASAPPSDPISSGSATGFVSVNLNELDSEIFVDGAFVGNPPAKLKLAQGSHLVEVRKTGFKDYRKALTVNAGSDLTLRVVLEKN